MKKIKFYLFNLVALIMSVLPAVCATIGYFPLWRARGSAALLSGFTLIILLICIAPILKLIRRVLSSPSIILIWFFIFITFFALSNIADEMTVIAFVGFISNTVAAIIFKIAKRYG